VHAASVLTIVTLVKPTVALPVQTSTNQAINQQQSLDVRHIVFLAPDPRQIGSGGGGGGNRQPGPVRRAQGVGSDTITLRVKEPASATAPFTDVSPLAQVVLDARPLASGAFDQIGLPAGGVSYGTSTGPGSGGGVGTGIGTGIGSGRGPGIGPGSGGGIGGGIYRPGGAVTTPRVIAEVKPTYTNDALLHKIQGTVVLELVVTREGRPAHIRVVRSLDPGGLDEQAVTAAAQWRFEPGRLAGTPVDVLVTIMLDFWIR
jgi:protein TonB